MHKADMRLIFARSKEADNVKLSLSEEALIYK
jgi:hypothetical protein